MSIESFISSAVHLYNNEFYDASLCLICIAIDASSKSKYPSLKVGERYKKYVAENFRIICDKGFPGISADSVRIKLNTNIDNLKPDQAGYVGMNDIIYHAIRCGLVHNCDIDKSIIFTDTTVIGDWNKDKFYLPKDIIFGLINTLEKDGYHTK